MSEFLQGNNGKLSMMRLGFAVSMTLGSIVGLAGVVGMFFNLDHSATAITTGLALVGSGGWAKAVQAGYEVKR